MPYSFRHLISCHYKISLLSIFVENHNNIFLVSRVFLLLQSANVMICIRQPWAYTKLRSYHICVYRVCVCAKWNNNQLSVGTFSCFFKRFFFKIHIVGSLHDIHKYTYLILKEVAVILFWFVCAYCFMCLFVMSTTTIRHYVITQRWSQTSYSMQWYILGELRDQTSLRTQNSEFYLT